MDKFPEAFRRFENVVDTDEVKDFSELKAEFSSWAGERWVGSSAQKTALKVESHKLRIPTWRKEKYTVKGHSRVAYRDMVSGRFTKPAW